MLSKAHFLVRNKGRLRFLTMLTYSLDASAACPQTVLAYPRERKSAGPVSTYVDTDAHKPSLFSSAIASLAHGHCKTWILSLPVGIITVGRF